MTTRRKHGLLYSGIFLLFFGALALYSASLAKTPEHELRFTFEAESGLEPATLGPNLQYPINWPNWFKGVERAEAVNALGQAYGIRDQVVLPESLIQLEVKPSSAEKPYALMFRVVAFVPNEVMSLELVQDPSLKIRPYFKKIRWEIRISREGTRSLIQGTVSGQAMKWKTRVLGTLVPGLILPRFFYPDLKRLAVSSKPLSPMGTQVFP